MAEKKSINEASYEELQEVEGISPRRAEAIRDFIDERGGISSWEELEELEGFDEVWLGYLRQRFDV